MNQLSARARLFLFLLVVAAPVTATFALERAAQPAKVELRNGARDAAQSTRVKPETENLRGSIRSDGTK